MGTSHSLEEVFAEDDKYFPTQLQKMQFFKNYSRFNGDKGRRETWVETVDRTVSFLRKLSDNKLSEDIYEKIHQAILRMEVMPSMRLLAMAGEAAERDNTTMYNCSYLPVNSFESFHEALRISMAGCGVAFSVENQYVSQIPIITPQTGYKAPTFVIKDSAPGWADALRHGSYLWANGIDVDFDFSLLRPEGAPLKTKGGRSSGPVPLESLLETVKKIILGAEGRHLLTTEAQRLMTKVGDAAVSGGMRRTAMLSLFDADDKGMRSIKNGDLTGSEYLYNSNNSAVLSSEIEKSELRDLFYEMDSGQRGEPGMFFRDSVTNNIPHRRSHDVIFGTNPCSEVTLRPQQFCNLSAVISRPWDTQKSLAEKIVLATIIGTIQASATNFSGLRPLWRENAEEEAILGVDITGQMDCPAVRNPKTLQSLKELAIETNKKYAPYLGISQAAAITCCKPSGNTSQFVDCSSGIHPRWSEYYLRRIRINRTDPLFYVLSESGVELLPDRGESEENAMTWVATFPVKAPEKSVKRDDITALGMCNHWYLNKKYYTEHNPSVTITYKPEEVDGIIDWVWNHRDVMGGMSFLPHSGAKYDLMPYEEVSESIYKNHAARFPTVNFSRIAEYEKIDMTTASQELACMAGSCEI
jgi:ribonucleoside-triphosphate reductase